ncbi:hypothetical protein [uncultured Veillonella sp.]|jgi:hypothetical protein|uniref:hypothetical protein n=1 Tax=uncultured Veillonella sp. TaxID=159268 RepID=UPI0027DE7FC7|nr:hypothetical protein [uncultured Veillonella sp.]
MSKKVKQRFIRNFNAIDVTTQKDLNEFIKGKNKEIIYMSYGIYGMNGCIFTLDGEWYKIISRVTNLWIIA